MTYMFDEYAMLPLNVDNINGFEAHKRADMVIKSIIPKKPSTTLKRFGNLQDGGYVYADDFSNNDYLISFGVENDIGFEKEVESVFAGMDLYDYSVDNLPEPLANSHFYKEKISKDSSDSSSNINKCLSRVPADKDCILKIDIEGYEWEVFNAISFDDLSRFRQIAVEIHWTEKILNDEAYSIISGALSKITHTHQSVNVHANNWGKINVIGNMFLPNVLEITFLRKSSYFFQEYEKNITDSLNYPNNRERPEILFPYR